MTTKIVQECDGCGEIQVQTSVAEAAVWAWEHRDCGRPPEERRIVGGEHYR